MKLNFKIKESPLFWPAKYEKGVLWVLDETLIPKKIKYIKVTKPDQAIKVIRDMKTRAFGQFLVVLNTFLLEINTGKPVNLQSRIQRTAEKLNKSRPTFPFSEVTSVVVRWAQKAEKEKLNVVEYVNKNVQGYMMGIRARRLERVEKIAALIKDGDSILTHCNVSGELAMAAYICKQQKKEIHFFTTETRPYLQGTKLTSWELAQMGAHVTLIADNAVGSVMADGLINKVIVGSDRSCANGDFANKIGTYQIAVLAKEFKIPFYVLTQPSNKVKKGKDIPIEIRDANELLTYSGKKIFEGRVDGFYPGFDVIPNKFITGTVSINAHL